MEKNEILRGNPSDFNLPPNSIFPPPPPVMEMNLDSGGNSSFLNLNHWEQQSSAAADPHDNHFESALISSLVSSPTSLSSSPAAGCNLPPDSIVIRELIGRSGSICNNNHSNSRGSLTSRVINYQSSNDNNTSSYSSCYTTPLSSPPKLNRISTLQFPPPANLGVGAGFVTDPGFAERAARHSCFGAAVNYAQFWEPGKLSRVSSSQSLRGQLENNMMMMTMMARPSGESVLNVNNSDPRDDSSPLDPVMTPCGSEVNVIKKRKATISSSSSSFSRGSRGNGARHNPPKASDEENSNSNRYKSSSGVTAADADEDALKAPKEEQSNIRAAEEKDEEDKENNAKPSEPLKQDYIHVRARRGEATDSHSLDERVRREKISERMKFLQDLVPGCNKVTGKAVMLDEIINYVQSLQRQVEFISMKLATVNPRVDGVLTKDMHQAGGLMLPPHSSYQLEAPDSRGFSYANLPQGQGPPPLQSFMASNTLETQLDASRQPPSVDGFTDATSAPQVGALWEDDLHSVSNGIYAESGGYFNFSYQNFQGAPIHAKIQL